MKSLLAYLAEKSRAYEVHPLYVYLRNEGLPAGERLNFVPCLAHFVMSFADIYALVLREEPAKDGYQEIVNAHTYEDGGHWKWYLADLKALSRDPSLHFTDALRFVWSDSSAKVRLLTYRIARLGFGASSIEKLVLVHCIEAGGKIALSSTAPAASHLAKSLGRNLLYFGPHHVDTELQHTLEDENVHAELENVVLPETVRPALVGIIDQCFEAFDDFADGVLAAMQNIPAEFASSVDG